jgi:hypothetical protein
MCHAVPVFQSVTLSQCLNLHAVSLSQSITLSQCLNLSRYPNVSIGHAVPMFQSVTLSECFKLSRCPKVSICHALPMFQPVTLSECFNLSRCPFHLNALTMKTGLFFTWTQYSNLINSGVGGNPASGSGSPRLKSWYRYRLPWHGIFVVSLNQSRQMPKQCVMLGQRRLFSACFLFSEELLYDLMLYSLIYWQCS